MAPELDAFLEDLEYGWPWEVRPLQREGLRPNILIRVGRYAEAIDEYERELDRIWSTKSFSYYNMACAYASWSRDPGTRSAEFLRERALRCLEQAFASGWRDVGWMETDGDLDPIRDTERYKAVRRAIEIDLDLDADDLAPLPGQAPARRPQR
jgi:tetratricopeptide (TPR) repeat protein